MKKIFKPAKNIVVPNDKFAKKLFEHTPEMWQRTISGKVTSRIIEGKVRETVREGRRFVKITREVISSYGLRIAQNPLVPLTDAEREYLHTPLNLFDRAVMTAVISEWLAGNTEVTIPVVFRVLAGKIGTQFNPAAATAAEILASVKKLALIEVRADLTDACKSFGYNEGKPLKLDFTSILPCRIFKGVFCSKPAAQIIQITAAPPLYKIAKAKSQLLTLPRDIFDVKGMHNSGAVIRTKFYTAVRIAENAGSHKLNTNISLETILKKCELADASRDVQSTARKCIFGICDNFNNAGKLTYEKRREGREYAAVDINFTPCRPAGISRHTSRD